MKRFFRILIVLAAVVAVMLFTCPDKEKHVEKVSNDVALYLQENVAESDETGMLESVVGNAIAGSISDNLVYLYIKNQLKVADYVVLNVGKIKYKGKEQVVSVGLFNHVFSFVKYAR